ncbi:hypothetical protein [Bacillus altitudinis]|uniref:hypothetical protein n=1 Tax=Bacillus altitudinis TaxID=293387 RepID=UPI0007769838|nr:hypothetical protein [Bacillus altitudinis]MBR0581005.1 hypothetical protein [Bacillus altitudinis A23-8]PYH27205.1 hypothetical protein US8_01986 [Bacillus altitudinis]
MRNKWFGLFRHSDLEKLENYEDHVESTLSHELMTIGKNVDALSEEQKEYYVDMIYDEISDYRDDFPAIMRYSLLISIYTYLEHELNKFCQHYNAKGFKEYDRKEKGIKRAKGFIKKELNMNFPDRTKEWNFICNVSEIRNCLVHAQGYIDEMKDKSETDDKTENKDHIKKKSDKEETKVSKAINALGKDLVSVIEGANKIKLHENFNKEFIKHVKTFLDNLDEINESPPDI